MSHFCDQRFKQSAWGVDGIRPQQKFMVTQQMNAHYRIVANAEARVDTGLVKIAKQKKRKRASKLGNWSIATNGGGGALSVGQATMLSMDGHNRPDSSGYGSRTHTPPPLAEDPVSHRGPVSAGTHFSTSTSTQSNQHPQQKLSTTRCAPLPGRRDLGSAVHRASSSSLGSSTVTSATAAARHRACVFDGQPRFTPQINTRGSYAKVESRLSSSRDYQPPPSRRCRGRRSQASSSSTPALKEDAGSTTNAVPQNMNNKTKTRSNRDCARSAKSNWTKYQSRESSPGLEHSGKTIPFEQVVRKRKKKKVRSKTNREKVDQVHVSRRSEESPEKSVEEITQNCVPRKPGDACKSRKLLNEIENEMKYLEFVRSVSLDLVKCGVYTNRALKQSLARHKARSSIATASKCPDLDQERCRLLLEDLRIDLGIPSEESDSEEERGYGVGSRPADSRKDPRHRCSALPGWRQLPALSKPVGLGLGYRQQTLKLGTMSVPFEEYGSDFEDSDVTSSEISELAGIEQQTSVEESLERAHLKVNKMFETVNRNGNSSCKVSSDDCAPPQSPVRGTRRRASLRSRPSPRGAPKSLTSDSGSEGEAVGLAATTTTATDTELAIHRLRSDEKEDGYMSDVQSTSEEGSTEHSVTPSPLSSSRASTEPESHEHLLEASSNPGLTNLKSSQLRNSIHLNYTVHRSLVDSNYDDF